MPLKRFLALSSLIFSATAAPASSVDQMSLEEKVGQLLIVHFHGKQANEISERLISEAHVGGFIYYEWSNTLQNFSQVCSLSNQLQEQNRKHNNLPLFIATDQEGGDVTRLKKEFTHFPSANELGKLNTPALAYMVAKAQAEELKFAGLNMNFAPVADITCPSGSSMIGRRSYGTDPFKVAQYVRSSLAGYQDEKILAVVKHFPGHGHISEDPHYARPILHKSLQELLSFELIPFHEVKNEMDAIMTSHFIVEGVDPHHTASTSSALIKDLLRSSWHFQGLVITDSLAMRGFCGHLDSLAEEATQALIAGNDILCLGGKLLNQPAESEISVDEIIKIHSHIVNEVKTGKISQQTLDEKVERIAKHKQKYCYDLSNTSNDITKTLQKNDLLNKEIEILLRLARVENSQAEEIAKKIWHNETGSSKEKLLHWNSNEDFLSLGIGHFIWYPKEKKTNFEEAFPLLIKYMLDENIDVPTWICNAACCPWDNKESFLAALSSDQVKELRSFLINTMDIQGKYMIAKTPQILHEIIHHPSIEKKKTKILNVLDQLSKTREGLYALVDYLNFKGSGISLSERYQGKGWGLMQALNELSEYPSSITAKDFSAEAKKLLESRVDHAPDSEKEKKWLSGWINRVNTYAQPL